MQKMGIQEDQEQEKNNIVEPIQIKFSSLELFFQSFEKNLELVRQEKLDQFETKNLDEHIDKRVDLVELVFTKKLNSRRNYLIDQFDKKMRHHMKLIQLNYGKSFFTFLPSKKTIYDCNFLIGSLIYKNKFSILKKLKYMDYLNQLENKIELIDELNYYFHVRALILNINRLFIYLRTKEGKTFFKIFNNKCKEYISIEINDNLIYKNILAINAQIVCLFYHQSRKYFILSVYDDELNLLRQTKIDYEINLCSLSVNEVICWDVKNKKCLVYDFDLSLVDNFGQCEKEEEPFYFCDGIIIEASTQLILFYYYSESYPKHFIKIINRRTGLLNGVINIDFDYFSKMIRIDTESNILFKTYDPSNLLKYYDSNGKLIGLFSNNEFTKFSRIDLTKSDELICFDKTDNKIFFL